MTEVQHLVAVALPAQGHLNVVMRFCKLLLHHCPDALVTFVDVDLAHDSVQEAATPPSDDTPDPSSCRLRRAHLPVQGIDLTKDSRVLFSTLIEALHSISRPLHELILRLNGQGPPVTCLLSDFAVLVYTQYAVEQLGIPLVVLYPYSASRLLLIHYVLQEERISAAKVRTTIAAAPSEKEFFCDGLSGLPTLFNIDLPHIRHFVDDSLSVWDHQEQCFQIFRSKAHSVIVNTFEELETSALTALSNLSVVPICAIGPLIETLHAGSSTAFWKEDDACMSWLDRQPRLSVLYISFGSIAVLSQAQVQEILEALVSSEQRFLWSCRRDLVEGTNSVSVAALIDSKSCGRGFVVDWAPQVKVLAHPSVGGFLTHCGWNSIIESVAHGVPMICWPYFADQPLNARCIVDEWKLGLAFEASGEDLFFIDRKEVERVIRLLMTRVEGEILRRNVSTLAEACSKRLSQNGVFNKDVKAFIQSFI